MTKIPIGSLIPGKIYEKYIDWLTLLDVDFFLQKLCICIFRQWNNSSIWDSSSRTAMNPLCHTFNSMAADELATQRARASTAICYSPSSPGIFMLLWKTVRLLEMIFKFAETGITTVIIFEELQWRHMNTMTWQLGNSTLRSIILFRRTPKKTSKLRIPGPLLGESTGHRWIPLTKG